MVKDSHETIKISSHILTGFFALAACTSNSSTPATTTTIAPTTTTTSTTVVPTSTTKPKAPSSSNPTTTITVAQKTTKSSAEILADAKASMESALTKWWKIGNFHDLVVSINKIEKRYASVKMMIIPHEGKDGYYYNI